MGTQQPDRNVIAGSTFGRLAARLRRARHRRSGHDRTPGPVTAAARSHRAQGTGIENTQAIGVIGVIGDPHAEDDHLEHALSLLAAHQPDVVVCTGDVVDGLGDPGRTIELLRGHDVLTVRGNHDRWLLTGRVRDLPAAHHDDDLRTDDRAWLAQLPTTRRLTTTAGDLLLCHGIDTDDMNKLRTDDYGYTVEQNDALLSLLTSAHAPAVVVKGHTHRGGVARFGLGRGPSGEPATRLGGELLLVDAGTLRRDHGPTCAVLDLREATLTRYDLTTGERHQSDLPLAARHASDRRS